MHPQDSQLAEQNKRRLRVVSDRISYKYHLFRFGNLERAAVEMGEEAMRLNHRHILWLMRSQ